MKTMRNILISLSLVSALCVSAQIAQQPSCEFRSTSAMVSSGSTLPMSAQTGVVVGVSSPTARTSAHGGRVKRDSNPFGDETVETIDNPNQPGTPLGDGVVPMLICALAYAVYSVARVYRRKRRV